MLVIAERLNCTRKRVKKAVQEKDADLVRDEASRQAEAGADYIDVNSATGHDTEIDNMKWMIEQVRAVCEKPLSIDTANPKAMRAGLELHESSEPAILNSVTAEQERLEQMVPLAAEFKTRLIALTMDDRGMPESVDDRLRALEGILSATDKAGLSRDRLYVDPLFRPVSTNPSHATDCMETIRRIKAEFAPVRTVGGVSNVSFGLPKRNLLNRVFLALAVEAGLDAGIVDPLEPGIVATLYAADAVLNRDEFCMNYIAAEREGRLG